MCWRRYSWRLAIALMLAPRSPLVSNAGGPRPRARVVPAACLLLVCIAWLVSGCGGGHKTTNPEPAPTRTASQPTTTVSQPVTTGRPRTDLTSIFEDEHLLYTDFMAHQNVAGAFAQYSALGVQTLRVFIPWKYLAPDYMSYTRPKVDLTKISSYTESYWVFLDAIDDQAKLSHIRIQFDIGAGAPYWAFGKDPQTSAVTGGWKPNAAEFGDLVHAIGQRYSGTYTPAGASSPLPRVSQWSIWNEPNAVYLTPNAVGSHQTPFSPRLYRALVDAAWQGLAETGHTPKRDTILIGETAPRGQVGPHLPGATGGLLPLIFIRALYCVSPEDKPLTGAAATTLGCPASGSTASFRAQNPGLFQASGWANHPYSDTSPPNLRVHNSKQLPASVTSQYTDFASLSQLENGLDGVFRAYGSNVQIPIYSTEYGYVTNPPNPGAGVSDTAAAAYMNEAEYLSWLNPRIRTYSHYLLTDAAPSNGFATGLESYRASTYYTTGLGTPKPDVYDAYRMPLWLPSTTAAASQKLEVWGCVRPINDLSLSSPQLAIQLASPGSDRFSTIRTVTLNPSRSGCYFETAVAFPHSGSVRLSFDDDGSSIHSRTQAITVQ
jgi:hypothetical protein